jgi:hypothetical protein
VAVSLSFNRRLQVVVALAVAVGLILCKTTALDLDDVLCLAPAFLLMVTLLGRRYPGERLLLGIAAGRSKRRFKSETIEQASGARAVHPPRGGLLMGFALAVRPPPRPSAAS